ncbi:hypothetical protein HZB88_04580 [archaeon]|nr:hypothetical protein [archaeon]
MLGGGSTQTVTISSHCEPWQAPDGGENCELCDKPMSDEEGGLALDDINGDILQGYSCTEYKCKSLGKGCEYIKENEGTDRAKCFWSEPNDVNRPEIEFWFAEDDSGELTTGDYEPKTEDSYEKGVQITKEIEPYHKFSFGIKTDELSQCRLDTEMKENYDSMNEYFPDSYFDYYHNQSRLLLANTTYSFYIRCADYNGNGKGAGVPAYEIRVSTGKGEDKMAPEIIATSINDGAYIAYGVENTTLTVYIDEPACCKWASERQDYDMMGNDFGCSTGCDSNGVTELGDGLWFDNFCTTLLPVSYGTNNYYFSCKDVNDNANAEPYSFGLTGTNPLNIDYTAPPNATYYNDAVLMEVRTSSGAESGKATCQYKRQDYSYAYATFYQTNSSEHKQTLTNLTDSSYIYDISCYDAANNINTTSINFTIDTDEYAPELLEIYTKDSNLYIKLDETADCEYSTSEFESGEGADMATQGSNTYSLTAAEDKYYIICEDNFGNQAEWEVNIP